MELTDSLIADPPAVLKSVLRIVHFVGLALGLGGATLLDLMIVKFFMRGAIQPDHWRLFRLGRRIVYGGLVLLWITGILLVTHYALFDPARLANSKLWAKMMIVLILTMNAFFIHLVILPKIEARVGAPLFDDMSAWEKRIMIASGVLSAVSWYVPMLLGALPQLNHTVSMTAILQAYALALACAIGIAYCALLLLQDRVRSGPRSNAGAFDYKPAFGRMMATAVAGIAGSNRRPAARLRGSFHDNRSIEDDWHEQQARRDYVDRLYAEAPEPAPHADQVDDRNYAWRSYDSRGAAYPDDDAHDDWHDDRLLYDRAESRSDHESDRTTGHHSERGDYSDERFDDARYSEARYQDRDDDDYDHGDQHTAIDERHNDAHAFVTDHTDSHDLRTGTLHAAETDYDDDLADDEEPMQAEPDYERRSVEHASVDGLRYDDNDVAVPAAATDDAGSTETITVQDEPASESQLPADDAGFDSVNPDLVVPEPSEVDQSDTGRDGDDDLQRTQDERLTELLTQLSHVLEEDRTASEHDEERLARDLEDGLETALRAEFDLAPEPAPPPAARPAWTQHALRHSAPDPDDNEAKTSGTEAEAASTAARSNRHNDPLPPPRQRSATDKHYDQRLSA